MKFLCDQMCAEIGRWLRAAGYDTDIIHVSLQDQKIFEKAVEEMRILITRDKHFRKWDPEGKIVIFLRSDDLEKSAQQLRERGIDWLFCPFSRCLKCNSLLKKVSVPKAEQIPENVQECWLCPTCKQIFWLGSHTEHMESQLKTWKKNRMH